MYSRRDRCAHDGFCYPSRRAMCELSTCAATVTTAGADKCEGGSWYVNTRNDNVGMACYRGTSCLVVYTV